MYPGSDLEGDARESAGVAAFIGQAVKAIAKRAAPVKTHS
jgi:hypothetical protein